MKIVLFSGFPLDSSYNYTVNTNDWDTLVAQYYGKTREELYASISSSTEFNFIDRDSVHASCAIDIATVTKIVKAGKTPKISTDYNYAIVYDNINNEYKHYFITGWDFVSSKKVGTAYNNVYNVSFSLNLLAYFKVCETNTDLPKDILVDRTHIWDDVSKYSSEGQNINPNYLVEHDFSTWSMGGTNLVGNNNWYYIISTKNWNNKRYIERTQMGSTSTFYCYCLCDSGNYCVNTYYDTDTAVAENSTKAYISSFSIFMMAVSTGSISIEDVVKIYTTKLPPASYINNIDIENVVETFQPLYSGISVPIKSSSPKSFITLLVLGKCQSNKYISSTAYSDGKLKLNLYPYKQLQLVDNNTLELEPNFNYRLYTALSPTKLGFVVRRVSTSTYNGEDSKCQFIDCSNEIPLTTSAWLQYIAYNKNYYQMGVDIPRERAENVTTGALFNITGGMLSGFTNAITKNPISAIGGVLDRVVSQAGNIAVSQANADTTIKQNQLQWDNIKNSPDKIKTLGTNIGLYSIYSDFKVFIKQLADSDRKTLETLFYRSGYKYGANVDTYAKLFVCTNFNYVKLGEPLFARYYGENLTDMQRDLLSEIVQRGITYFEPSWFISHGLDYPETNPYKETT